MKQVLQNLANGETVLEDVPVPQCPGGHLLIQSIKTLVSAGTERMLVDFGKGNMLQKARQQPDKVKQVLEKAKTDGVAQTIDAVRNKLDTPLPLGYCNVGTVVESQSDGFSAGDRVVSNGKHAEFVVVPKNLCAKIPDSVDDEAAVFTVIGSIALQGIRLIKPTLGEAVVVTGLGLIGLVAVQLLRAHGCRVLGVDFDSSKCELARQFGAETVDLSQGQNPVAIAEKFSRGRGIDAVLITASTKSNEPIHQATTMCRKRGRIVLVGVVGMEMSRDDFYEKELSFQVSCSYGPGRYDANYEENGNDYPFGLVRWTEQRNFEAILDMMADGRIDMKPLISHRFALSSAKGAYDVISNGNPLGVVLEYSPSDYANIERIIELAPAIHSQPSKAVLGFIGAGNYASAVLVPAFKQAGARLKSIASATGVSSVHVGKKNGVEQASTDSDALLADEAINALVITTRHSSHANWVLRAITAGKHVFVEKPLALTKDELNEIRTTYESLAEKPLIMVGFNRRYSPLVEPLKKAMSQRAEPKAIIMTINAGEIPVDHWTQDPAVGGGRIIGEGCHFIDLARHLIGASISSVNAIALESQCNDSVSIQLKFSEGSIATINYLANGHKGVAKERLEIFCGGSIAMLDNFRKLNAVGWSGLKSQRLLKQDKGQVRCANAFVDSVETGSAKTLIAFDELYEVAAVCFDLDEQIRAGR